MVYSSYGIRSVAYPWGIWLGLATTRVPLSLWNVIWCVRQSSRRKRGVGPGVSHVNMPPEGHVVRYRWVVWAVGRLSVCAVHVRMSGDARTGLAHELRVNEGLWVWVLVALEGPVVLLEQPVFCQVEEAQEVGMDEASSPPFRGCRVLKVVESYL